MDEATREGTLEDSEKRMIEGIIDLREVDADHIMTPRTEMVTLPIEATFEEAIERARERGLSRLPVYRETPDDIAGVLYMKDLLPYLVPAAIIGKVSLEMLTEQARHMMARWRQ